MLREWKRNRELGQAHLAVKVNTFLVSGFEEKGARIRCRAALIRSLSTNPIEISTNHHMGFCLLAPI